MRAQTGRPLEKHEQTAIVQLLRVVGADVYVLGTRRPHTDYQGTRQTPGLPDVYALLPAPRRTDGRPCAVWIECKRRGGRLSPAQQQFPASCHAAGVAHVVGDSDAVIAWLLDGGWLAGLSTPAHAEGVIATYTEARRVDLIGVGNTVGVTTSRYHGECL